MFKKIKEWYRNLGEAERDNLKAILGVLTIVGMCCFVVWLFLPEGDNLQQTDDEATVATNDQISDGEYPYCYEDTVFAIAAHTGYTMNGASSYTEIVFGHGLYLYCKETSGSTRHYDFNDPVYVESGDLCVVWVEVNGDEKIVTLVENLSKEGLALADVYFYAPLEDPLEDRD